MADERDQGMALTGLGERILAERLDEFCSAVIASFSRFDDGDGLPCPSPDSGRGAGGEVRCLQHGDAGVR
jgi:hypothetical protein